MTTTTMPKVAFRAQLTFALCIWVLLSQGTYCVVLNDIIVPSVVQNGSVAYVVLDCQFSMNHSEKDGMILKWYLNGRTVYQWIPPARPQGLGEMRGKINLDYEISPDPYGRHRALYLFSPTTDMSGDYTCKVSTMQNEVTMSKKMIVYVPPRKVQMTNQKCSNDQVNVTCMVDYIFPEPIMALYLVKSTSERVRLKGVEERTARYSGGAWQKIIFLVISDKTLAKSQNTFECDASLLNTEFITRRRTVYVPSNPTVMASASDATQTFTSFSWHNILILVSTFLFRKQLPLSR